MLHERALWALFLVFGGCSTPDEAPRSVDDSDAPAGFPFVEVRPDALDFGTVAIGTSTERIVAVVNAGTADLDLEDVRFAHDDAALVHAWSGPEAIAPGAFRDIAVTWSPTQGHSLDSELVIASNDPLGSELEIPLRGSTSAPHIEVSPLDWDFGTVVIDSTYVMGVTIANTGDGDLRIDSLEYFSSDPGDLWFEGLDTPFVIAIGGSVEVRVRYQPSDHVEDEGVLTIASDDLDAPTVHAAQRGGVLALPPCVVAAWMLEGDVSDATGHGNDGTAKGAVLTADRNGVADGAYYLDGSTYLDIPGSTSLDAMEAGGEVTVAAWLSVDRWSVVDGNRHFPLMEKYRPSNDDGWELMLYGPSRGAYADLLTAWVPSPVSAGFEFVEDTWYFVAVAFDQTADEARFYVDGARIGTAGFDQTLGPTDGGDVHIGRSLNGLDESAIGTVDDLYLFDCVLTDEEIADLYAER